MNPRDTTIARGGPGFPKTAWSVIRDAQNVASAEQSRALDRLISVYWRPVYWSLRLDWNECPEAAKDLTQEYFAAFLERSMVHDVREEWGRFRAYVKVSLKHFMLSQRRRAAARKRSVERRIVPLDDLERVERDATAREAPPDRRFERELMESILSQALADLARHCAQEGRERAFELFKTYYLDRASDQKLTYDDLAKRHALGPHDVKNRLAELRVRFRRLVIGYVRDGVSSEDELVVEIKEVFEA